MRQWIKDCLRTSPTPASLMAKQWHTLTLQTLEEVDRLEGLVRAAHRADIRCDRWQTTVDAYEDSWSIVCWGCRWNMSTTACGGCAPNEHDGFPCGDDCPDREWEPDEYFDTEELAVAAHAGHVQALIDGGA
jgi:hypothetical protein